MRWNARWASRAWCGRFRIAMRVPKVRRREIMESDIDVIVDLRGTKRLIR